MEKMTSGPGWALGPDHEPRATGHVKKNTASPTAKIRLEKRNGKFVTVIAGLHTYGADRLETIAKELKTACGAGGTVKNGMIEIQGDKTTQIKQWFDKLKTSSK